MYTPSQGIFVNGRIADADDLVNEFSSIAGAILEVDNKLITVGSESTKESKAYADSQVGSLTIDGGVL